MRKEVLVVLAMLFLLPSVFAASVSMSETNSTLITVSISNAVDLYAYEVSFDYTGTLGTPTFANFLGDYNSNAYGSSTRGSLVKVYESRLDASQTGVSGSGTLFTLPHVGTISLNSAKFVAENGTPATASYISSDSSSSTTSSGGGSSTTRVVAPVLLSANVNEINIKAVYGKSTASRFTLSNSGTTSVTVEFSVTNSLEGSLSSPLSVTIPAGSSQEITLSISPSSRTVNAGILSVLVDGTQYLALPVIITPRSENFLFDASLTLSDVDRRITQGSSLDAQVILLQVGPHEKVDVVATYVIKDFSGNTLLEESETFFVLDSKDFVKEFPTNALPPGKYILGLELVYPNAFATSSTQFEVTEARSFLPQSSLWLILTGLVLFMILLVAFYVLHRNPQHAIHARHSRPQR